MISWHGVTHTLSLQLKVKGTFKTGVQHKALLISNRNQIHMQGIFDIILPLPEREKPKCYQAAKPHMVKVLPAQTCSLLKGHTESDRGAHTDVQLALLYGPFHISNSSVTCTTNSKDNLSQWRNAASWAQITSVNLNSVRFCLGLTTTPSHVHVQLKRGLANTESTNWIFMLKSHSALPELSARLAVRNPRLKLRWKNTPLMKKKEKEKGHLQNQHWQTVRIPWAENDMLRSSEVCVD